MRLHPESTRRTIYDFVDRANLPDVMINFDFATPDMVTGIRHVTTVPQQALFLMNSPIVIELAKRLVAMPDFVGTPDDAERLLQLLFSLVMASFPVEAWRQPNVPDSGAAYLDLLIEPRP